MLYFRKLKLERIFFEGLFLYLHACAYTRNFLQFHDMVVSRESIYAMNSTLEWISPNCILFVASDMHVNLKFSQELRYHCNI